MGVKKLDFHLKANIFDELVAIQDKLPAKATGGKDHDDDIKGSYAKAYQHPAGMALLGEKDGEVDTVIPLKMSGGCWDAPNINYSDMDEGFRALIDTDRVCAGMALVRNPKWHTAHDSTEGIMPDHLRSQLYGMRKNFPDITKTAWIVLHNSYFRVYRPTRGEGGRIGTVEVDVKSLFTKEDKENKVIAYKIEHDKEIRKAKAMEIIAKRRAVAAAKKEEARIKKEALEAKIAKVKAERDAELAKLEAAHKEAEAARAKAKKKSDELNKKLKAGEEAIIDAGGGYVYLKQPNGEYVLWQTSKK